MDLLFIIFISHYFFNNFGLCYDIIFCPLEVCFSSLLSCLIVTRRVTLHGCYSMLMTLHSCYLTLWLCTIYDPKALDKSCETPSPKVMIAWLYAVIILTASSHSCKNFPTFMNQFFGTKKLEVPGFKPSTLSMTRAPWDWRSRLLGHHGPVLQWLYST